MPYVLVTVLLIAGSGIGFWAVRIRRPRQSAQQEALEFTSVDDMVGTYTERLLDLTSRITKTEIKLLEVRKELKVAWIENEALKTQIDQLKAENKELKEKLGFHDE